METETISGVVRHITFRNPDNGYTVLKLVPDKDIYAQNPDGTLTVVGNLRDSVDTGDAVEFMGGWVENPQYGMQFRAVKMERIKRKATSNPTPSALPVTDSQATLLGTVERVTYYNPDNGWAVIKISPQDNNYPPEAYYDGVIAVVGVMPELVEGESAQFIGKWVNNDQYGKQFKAAQVIPIAPQSQEGIIRYIADTVFGIGEATARRIYQHFGAQAIDILDSNPERIREVGIKRNLEENFIAAWGGSRSERQIMIHLQGYGISSRLAKKIYDEYGNTTLQVLQSDPYQLATDIFGIGFKKADTIARGMGIAADAPSRLRSGLVYALSELANDGHTFAPREVLIAKATELLGIEEGAIDLDEQIREQLLAGNLKADILNRGEENEIGAIYLPMYYHSEVGAAEKLYVMATSPSKLMFRMENTDWSAYLDELSAQNNVKLSALQQSAVRGALTSKISVLTGGPGTGKTTTLQMVINALEQEQLEYALASPTGRAAKRLAEATGQEARTIHRLLGWNPLEGGFEYDEDNPLPVDMVVIDETSMVDLILFYNLLKALRPSAHLMLVGDVDQLPSVGAGNVLNDVIHSGVASVTRLTQIFRQEDTSHIISNAHRINRGELPYMDNNSEDFFFFNAEEPQEAADLVVDIVINRLGRKLGEYDPIRDVQVIAPMYRGAVGVNILNERLQEMLNPGGNRIAEKKLNGRIFRRGDKVMQTKNNYEKDVFNGDIGYVYGIDDDENVLRVMMDGRAVDYEYSDAEEQLIHAYCISTHRSQGSEYPVVVMPVMSQHFVMLQRNLLYTAITRARQLVVLVGMRKAVAIAVNNNKVAERFSGLQPRLASRSPQRRLL